jgi:hypothetical protein
VRNATSTHAISRVDANTSQGLAQLTLQFYDEANVLTSKSWQSNLFSSWQQNGFQIWAGYDAARYAEHAAQTGWAEFLAEGGFWDDLPPGSSGGFLIWESEANPSYTDEVMPGRFSLGPQTDIYIGHNPDTNAYFNGTIRAVSVDPGCRGH